MSSKHIGRMAIADELLLNWLQFSGGQIRDISFGRELGTHEISIEHEDMPLVEEGELIPYVHPSYTRHESSDGHFVVIRDRGGKK